MQLKLFLKLKALKSSANIVSERLKKTSLESNTASIQVSKWWFVISGEESILDQLAKNWDAVKIQTNWSLEPIFSYGNPTDQATNSSCVLNKRPCTQPSQSTQTTDDSEISGDSSALQTLIHDPDATRTTDLSNETQQEPDASRAHNSAQSG